MGWIEKERKTNLEDFPIHGLFFLDGDIIAAFLALKYGASPTFNPDWLKGHKFPKVEFPSGEAFDVWESSPEAEATVHLFGEMDLAYRATRNQALAEVKEIAEVCGYAVKARGEQQLDVWSEEDDERFLVIYDNENRRMVNVERLIEPVEPPIHPAHILMNDEIKSKLPPLYANEKIGLEALAPIKYFTPDGNWTWYASEFDSQDIFFGLVIGNEIELGYFSLSELQSVHGGLGLLIERDLHYEAKTLRDLQAQHRRERGEA